MTEYLAFAIYDHDHPCHLLITDPRSNGVLVTSDVRVILPPSLDMDECLEIMRGAFDDPVPERELTVTLPDSMRCRYVWRGAVDTLHVTDPAAEPENDNVFTIEFRTPGTLPRSRAVAAIKELLDTET